MREGRQFLHLEHINYLHFLLALSCHFTHQHYVRVSRLATTPAMRINGIFQIFSNMNQFLFPYARVIFYGKSGLCKEKVGILRGLLVIEFRLDTQKHASALELACFSLRLDVVEVDATVILLPRNVSILIPRKVRIRKYFSVVFFEHGWGC